DLPTLLPSTTGGAASIQDWLELPFYQNFRFERAPVTGALACLCVGVADREDRRDDVPTWGVWYVGRSGIRQHAGFDAPVGEPVTARLSPESVIVQPGSSVNFSATGSSPA